MSNANIYIGQVLCATKSPAILLIVVMRVTTSRYSTRSQEEFIILNGCGARAPTASAPRVISQRNAQSIQDVKNNVLSVLQAD